MLNINVEVEEGSTGMVYAVASSGAGADKATLYMNDYSGDLVTSTLSRLIATIVDPDASVTDVARTPNVRVFVPPLLRLRGFGVRVVAAPPAPVEPRVRFAGFGTKGRAGRAGRTATSFLATCTRWSIFDQSTRSFRMPT